MKTSVQYGNRIERFRTQKHQRNQGRPRKPHLKLDRTQIQDLLRMYLNPKYTTGEIASRFHVAKASVTYFAKRAGLSLRKRGCKHHAAPSPAIQMILLEAWTDTYENAATRCGVSKQRVWKIATRWKTWALNQFGPREPRASNHRPEQSLPPQPHRPASPHVISFRVPKSIFTMLVQRSKKEATLTSPCKTARSLMLEGLKLHS